MPTIRKIVMDSVSELASAAVRSAIKEHLAETKKIHAGAKAEKEKPAPAMKVKKAKPAKRETIVSKWCGRTKPQHKRHRGRCPRGYA